MRKEQLLERTKKLTVNVFKFVEDLPVSRASAVISDQLLRRSSSIAANYRAVCRSKSQADFLNKLKIVNEEADETLFWLELVKDLDLTMNNVQLMELTKESNELVSIFSAAIKTMKAKLQK